MSSLVAYEDSESEGDYLDPTEEETSASGQTAPCEQNQEVRMCKPSEMTPRPHSPTPGADRAVAEHNFERRSFLLPPPPQPQRRLDSEINDCSVGTARGDDVRAAAAALSSPVSRGKSSPLQTLPHATQRFGDGLNPAKGPPPVRAGVRPYIPKRQRLAPSGGTADPRSPAEPDPGGPTRDGHAMSDVSARIAPHLSHKPGAAGTPRRLLLTLGGHRGPVNTVRWCPVPHLSHLLLSASMDKTFKVWDGVESGRCLRVYACHSGAVRDARWSLCGRHLLSGSFDNKAAITDVETGQPVVKLDNQFRVMCVAPHPSSPEVLLCGGYSPTVKAWDSRSGKVVNVYKAGIQQTLDVLFLRGGVELITSSDCVSRDSADRTLIAWDYRTTAKLSNQIYQERFTCPSLALHPLEEAFVAQSNGDYTALFSSQRPYRMNKRRRYDDHKVEGYAVQCQFSPDGTILASGSSSGSAHFYDFHSARLLHTLLAHSRPCLGVAQHPLLPATAATCDWAGEIKVWH